MQLWSRKSIWLALSVCWLLFVLLGVPPLLRLAEPPGPQTGAPQGWPRWLDAEFLQSFSQPGELLENARRPQAPRGDGCTWGACFDTSQCRGAGLKVFVYPAAGPISEIHRRILASIEGSRYHTFSPSEACLLLLLSLDAPAGESSPEPPRWSGGRNHLILRLHPGPRPLTSQLGQAMVAGASPTVDTFRPGFDVALPLLPEAHPWRGGAPGQMQQHSPHPGVPLLALAEERGRWRTAGTNASACPWNGHCEQDPGPEQSWLPSRSCPLHGSSPCVSRPSFYGMPTSPQWRRLFTPLWRLFRTGSLEPLLTLHCCGTAPQGHSWPCLLFPQVRRTSPSTICNRILVLWSSERPPPPRGKWPETAVPLTVLDGPRKASDRFFPYSAISTDAILSLDAHSNLSTSEVDFAFVVWQSFPERMVGFLTWSHFWNEAWGGWGYTAEKANEFSIVLTTAAFYHRYYHTLFTQYLPKALRTLADEAPTCVDVLMNFLVAAVTKLPPIKVPYGKEHQEAKPPLTPGVLEPQPPAWDCINRIAAGFGHMPLVSSRLRLDPVLFKDPVSMLRKKYRRLEKP
ncbi:exostosin-like 1 isoform X2 [Dasypus novemcinctus]|uniref:exostosin-like 1 isoform X2 n=1 Tax=Dasypus novemcinctus TaxID=9361 RepID=UPI00265FB789|nr:exostosin-like 1 isoform X2 [Dasypus novemcinctus]